MCKIIFLGPVSFFLCKYIHFRSLPAKVPPSAVVVENTTGVPFSAVCVMHLAHRCLYVHPCGQKTLRSHSTDPMPDWRTWNRFTVTKYYTSIFV